MSASHVSHRFEVERVRRHIRWSQSTEIVCRADLDSFLIGAKTHRMVHRKMEDARRIPDEATGMNASDCSVGSNLNGSGISRQTFVFLTAEGPDGICFDAHCADESSAQQNCRQLIGVRNSVKARVLVRRKQFGEVQVGRRTVEVRHVPLIPIRNVGIEQSRFKSLLGFSSEDRRISLED